VEAKGGGDFGYVNEGYECPVMTKNETAINLSRHVYQTFYEGITRTK